MDQQEFVIDALPDKRVAAAALRDSEERFQQLAESINEVFWICTAENRQFLYISPAFEEIWGRSCSSVYEDPEALLDTVMPEDRSRLAAALSEPSLLPQTEIEYRILRPDHSMRWIRTRTFPVRSKGPEVYRMVGVSQDITDRKVAEKAILEISARERRRIGQDLHDSLLQQLAGIAMSSKVLQQRLASISAEDAAEAGTIGDLLQEAIRETRSLARGLNPVQMDAHGLVSALRELARSTEKLYKIPCVFECGEAIKIHDYDAATHLYRIAQEAVSNAIKHAEPAQVFINLIETRGLLILRICDNGKGFPENLSHETGMGLHIMNYRARMIGATLAVQRDAGGGTFVVCSYSNTWR